MLALLLAADLLLIGLYVLWGYDHWTWSLENEAGPSERFQHLKWAVAAILLVFLSIRRRAVIYSVWALLFAYFAVDDSIRLHEREGAWLARVLDLVSFEEIYRTFPRLDRPAPNRRRDREKASLKPQQRCDVEGEWT